MKRRKGRYQETAPNKAKDRKYTSYEDAPLEEYEETMPAPTNLTKKFINVFLILFVAVLGALAFFYIDVLTPENISHWFHYELLGKTEGKGYPIRYEGISINSENFDLIGGTPVYCSDTSVVMLNNNAGDYQNIQHAFAKPILKTNGNYAVVYNSDAIGYKIMTRNDELYSNSADKKILDCDITSSGSFATLTYGNDYLSALTVYKSDNSKRYSYSFADYYVNRVSLSNDNSKAALSGVSANNGGLISVIYILDFNQENYLQKYEVEDSYIYDLCYLDNGNVIAVGETGSYYVDVGSGKKYDHYFDNRTLTTFILQRKLGALLSLSDNPDGRSCDIVSIDPDGKKEFAFSTNKKLISFDYNGGVVSALFPSEIVLYDSKGQQLAGSTVSADTRKICLSDDHKTVYSLGKSEISKSVYEYIKE